MRSIAPRTGRILLAAGLISLLAACNANKGTPTASLEGYTPDPALKTASAGNLTGRVRHACTVTQSRLQSVPVPLLKLNPRAAVVLKLDSAFGVGSPVIVGVTGTVDEHTVLIQLVDEI